MLRGIRTASANWLGRIIMGVVMTVLAGTFALWGINDIFRNFGRSGVAKIGSTEIPIEQFRQTFNDRLQLMSKQFGRPITPQQASGLGIDRQVLSEMVAQAGLDQNARQMGLGIGDAEIARRIKTDPNLQTASGQFDAAKFALLLRNAGYTEPRFVAEQRQTTLRRQIIDTISGDLKVPKTWLEAINQYQNEQRNITYVTLGPAQAGDIPQPTAEQLSKYFDERKILFRAPETRKIVTVALTPAELAKTLEISDDDVKRAFEKSRSRYITPERRRVEQMVFPTMAEAQAASDRIKSGTTFAALATERGLKQTDIDLGSVAKSGIIDPAVAEAAFALKDGEVSAPVQGRFGAVLVTVTKIEPEDAKPFADMAPQIRNDLALERAKTQVRDIHDKIEDDRAGGGPLEEAAKKLKLPVTTVEAIDRSGRDPSGKLVTDLPRADKIVSAAFASDVGVDNDPIDADGGYLWYDVASITPAHERKLDEVKADVEQHWHDDQVATRLKAKAAEILDKLKNGTTFETLAVADGLKLETADNLKRGGAAGAIAPSMIKTVFTTALDAFNSAEGDQPTDWIVFRVTSIKTPSLDAGAQDQKDIQSTVLRQLSDDVFGQYMAWLENQLGTSINQGGLAQALSGNSAPDNGPPPDSY